MLPILPFEILLDLSFRSYLDAVPLHAIQMINRFCSVPLVESKATPQTLPLALATMFNWEFDDMGVIPDAL